MRSRRKVLIRSACFVVIGLLAAATIFLGIRFAKAQKARGKAEELVRDMEGLRMGESTTEDVQSVAQKYDGEIDPRFHKWECGEQTTTYKFGVFNGSIPKYSIQSRIANPIGLRPWGMTAFVTLANGRVVCTELHILVVRSDERFLSGNVRIEPRRADLPPELPSFAVGRTGPRFDADDILHVRLTSDASEEERRKAFDLNFDCLAGIGECRRACELMPSAWKEYVAKQRQEGKDPHRDELDRVCDR